MSSTFIAAFFFRTNRTTSMRTPRLEDDSSSLADMSGFRVGFLEL